jgi:hypothetical protein
MQIILLTISAERIARATIDSIGFACPISNIALEGICIGDVVGGLLLWTVESLQVFIVV